MDERKENGTNKLIELLNRYIKEKELGNTVKEIDDDFFVNNYNNWDGYLCEQVMSKNFGFIKWLCDGDKIDLFKLPKEFENICGFGLPNRIVMILSIQENPIIFLFSILK